MSFKVYISFLSLLLASLETPNASFKVPDYSGEIMHYNLSYGILNIGKAIVSFSDDSLGCGAHIKAEARSSGIVKFIKDISYSFESCMDKTTGLPDKSFINLRDRRHHVYNEAVFDRYSRIDSSIIHSQISGLHVAPINTYDLLTAYFDFRKNHIPLCLNPGQGTVTKIYIADILWDLRIRYVGVETIKTMNGKIKCLKFTPSTVPGNFFKNEDDMTMWFTDDENHVPIRVRLNLILGAVNIDMVEYQKPQ